MFAPIGRSFFPDLLCLVPLPFSSFFCAPRNTPFPPLSSALPFLGARHQAVSIRHDGLCARRAEVLPLERRSQGTLLFLSRIAFFFGTVLFLSSPLLPLLAVALVSFCHCCMFILLIDLLLTGVFLRKFSGHKSPVIVGREGGEALWH